jgi:hypothetical protein
MDKNVECQRKEPNQNHRETQRTQCPTEDKESSDGGGFYR